VEKWAVERLFGQFRRWGAIDWTGVSPQGAAGYVWCLMGALSRGGGEVAVVAPMPGIEVRNPARGCASSFPNGGSLAQLLDVAANAVA
jgi:hypothetical protein